MVLHIRQHLKAVKAQFGDHLTIALDAVVGHVLIMIARNLVMKYYQGVAMFVKYGVVENIIAKNKYD